MGERRLVLAAPALLAWRTRLQVLADRWGATLPADLQVAGQGEISPSPTGD